MSHRLTNWLVMMVKVPRAGAVKTRLAADVGTAEALRFYRHNVARTVRCLSRDRRWRLVLCVAPGAKNLYPSLPDTPRIPQSSGDLGARMQDVFDRMPPGPVCLIGGDIPGIARSDIAQAFRGLGNADAVFGPATDGGYWLVGMKRRPRLLRPFSEVRWSTEHALSDTLSNLSECRIAYSATHADVDTVEDYRAWRRSFSLT